MRSRYTIWDGSQTLALDAEEIFDRLAEHLSATDDLSEALSRLLRDGVAGDGFEAVGADELADRVRAAIEELYDRYNLTRSLEQAWNDLDDVVGAEEDVAGASDPAQRTRRLEALKNLSRILEQRMQEMADWPFADSDAKEGFDRLAEKGHDLTRVERFQRQYRHLFQGPESLDFDGTLAVMERFEKLRDLERALRERDFDAIDEDGGSGILGEEFGQSVGRLRQMMRMLVDAGYVVTRDGRATLSPKAARRMGRLALKEMLAQMLPDVGGRHDTSRRGSSGTPTEQARLYEYGDPMNIDVAATLKAALTREAMHRIDDRVSPGGRLSLQAGDLHVKESLRETRTSTVLLLDMSWSMSWEGRFSAAKKVALAMETLMRTRFPRDYFGIVGFYTRAVEIRSADLAEATWNMGDPFTNLQDGLRMGLGLLDRHPAATRQMIVITDGQPTAYFNDGRLYCEWPMGVGGISSRATIETLKEVERVTRKGVRINTFMLDDSPLLKAFVQKMTSINRGRAFYTTPEQLGHVVLVDHVGRKRKVL